MAAIVVNEIGDRKRALGCLHAGPTQIAILDESDVSTPNTSVVIDTKGVCLVAVQAIFAGYTAVTVKAQRSVDGINYFDIADMTLSVSNTGFSFDPKAPKVRLSITGTQSGGADSMSVWAYIEYLR